MMYSGSFLAALVAALACTAPAAASRPGWKAHGKHAKAPPAPVAELQLDNARVPQPVQRREFPLEGEDSAFKFNFADDVRTRLAALADVAPRCSLAPERRCSALATTGNALTDAATCRATPSTMRRCCSCI